MGTSGISDYVNDYVPWRKGVAWWVVALQGVFLAAMGIFFLVYTEDSIKWLLVILATYFVLAALWTIVNAMRGVQAGLSVFGLLAAGGGLVSGLAVLLAVLLPIGLQPNHPTLLFAFAVALVAMGVLMMASALVERFEQGISWIGIIRGALVLLVGAYILYALRNAGASDLNLVRWIAYAAIVVGVLLCIYAFTLYRSRREVSTTVPVS